MLQAYFSCVMEAGTDEAGRGCLAGPVTAAAVILPEGYRNPGLNDSKKIPRTRREELSARIREEALAWAVAHVDPQTIDRMNILGASILAMHRALDQLDPPPVAVAVDGNSFRPYREIPCHCLVKGDGRFLHIAAASILAKTSRDALMRELHLAHPQYGWDRNKGYPTQAHRDALLEYGPTPFHRKSFRLPGEPLKIGL